MRTLPPAMINLAPSLVIGGKYELIEEIGRGGMGTVWRAHSRALGRPCALKMLLPSARGGDDRQRSRMFREARVVAKLRSPYVVTVYDVGEWEGGPYIAMELLEGRSLRQVLQKTKIPRLEVTLELIRQVALGLDKAHEAGLIHRDLKPDNIFLLEHQPLHAKILDFGIAKATMPNDAPTFQSTTGSISGTPLYMSPEQALGKKDIDARSDLWSLAVIVFECLVGAPPFAGDTVIQLLFRIISEPLPVPSVQRPSLPPDFDRWWARAASRDPEERPESALILAERLRDVFAGQLAQAPVAHAPAVVSPPAQLPPKLRFALVASGIGTAAVGGLLYLGTPSGSPDVAERETPKPQVAAPAKPMVELGASAQAAVTPREAPVAPAPMGDRPPAQPVASVADERGSQRQVAAPPARAPKAARVRSAPAPQPPAAKPAEPDDDPLGF